MLRKLCSEKAGLQEDDVAILERIAENLQMMAELSGADVFIDCLLPDGQAIVVAESNPVSVKSAYKKSVVGMTAHPKNEPAVFHAFATGMPVRDLKAITQEKRSVRQNVVPVHSSGGKIIAVLIEEKDISSYIRKDEKYRKLAGERDKKITGLFTGKSSENPDCREIEMLEINHRVKNNLQVVASMLNLQARRSKLPEVKKILTENVNRVLSISAIHDILCASDKGYVNVNSRLLFQMLIKNYHPLIPENTRITFNLLGDDIELTAEKATSISIVVNELITNAVLHAFAGRSQGTITLTATKGILYNTISIEDDGVGFDYPAGNVGNLGLDIVSTTIKDKLKGKLRINSDSNGTKVVFDFT